MNVNPFSYLIEKLKSKFDKSGGTISGDVTIDKQSGTISTLGYSRATFGNNIPYGTDKNTEGVLRMYGILSKYTEITAPDSTNDRFIKFPDKDGTVALTSDINPVDVSSEFTPDSCIDSFKAYRSGKIITLDATLKAQSYSSGQQLFTSTNAVKPVVSFAVTLTDSNDKPEQSGVVWIQTSNQHRYFGNSMSGKHYFTATYISQ